MVEPAGGQSQRLQVAVALIAVALMFVGLLVVLRGQAAWALVGYVALTTAVITVRGRRYDDALRDDIRSGAAS